MMAVEFWFSVGLGAGIGLLYGLVSYLGYKRALLASHHRFLLLALGGMTVRLLVVVSLIAVILSLSLVQATPFVGAFFAVFIVALVLEVLALHRRQPARARNASPDEPL